MTLPTPPEAIRPWLIPLLALAVTLVVQFGGVVWFASGIQAGQADLLRRMSVVELVNPAVTAATTEKRLNALESDAKDFRTALGTIGEKLSLSNEKLARIEGQLGLMIERAQRPGVPR